MNIETSKSRPPQLYDRIREILESARASVARSVNTAQVIANYSAQNLWLIRQFYMSYPQLVQAAGIPHALRKELTDPANPQPVEILYALRGESWQPGLLSPNLSWTGSGTEGRAEA